MSTPWAWRQRAARLARRLPSGSGGSVLGDLQEEYRARIAGNGRIRTEWWLLQQTWSIRRAYAHYEGTPRSFSASFRMLRAGEVAQTLRSLVRTPWYAVTAIAVIALGTTLSTAIFALVDGTLFKPLPYQASSRLFAVSLGYSRLPEPLTSWHPVSRATVAEWRAGARDITFTAFYTGGLQTVGRHDSVRSAEVDPHFFEALGVRPLLGGFSSEDFTGPVKVRPAIVTATFWRSRLGHAAAAVGQVLTDEAGTGIRIVGVLPDTFVFPLPSRATFTPQLLVPLIFSPLARGDSLGVLARLAPNADVRSATEQVNAMVRAQAAARPRQNLSADLAPRARIMSEGFDRGGLEPIDSALRSSTRTRAWVVFSAAAALVLLACFNVTGLAIARANERGRDLVLRRALGAGGGDLVRLLAIESVLIVMAGTAGGLLLAFWAVPIGARLFAGDFMLTLKPAVIDVRVGVFVGVLAIAASAVVILLSARSVVRAGLRQHLAEGAGGTRRLSRRLSMISVEVAVAYLVTVTASLVVGSLVRASSEDTGFDVPDAAVLRMSAPPNSAAADIESLIADIGGIPGVQAAGGVAHPVLQKAFNGSVFDSPPGISPQEHGPAGGSFPIESVPVTGGFFPAAGLAARDGRLPTEEEFRNGAPVIVITETVARDYWPGQRAVGQILTNKGRPFEVIGVVNDARFLSLDLAAQGEIFWPVAAMPKPYLSNVVLRFAPDAAANTVDAVAATVRARCPECWVREALTLQAVLSENIRLRRFSAWLFSGFGVAALLIVGTGILGVVALGTTRRVREIGIRMALGATRPRVLWQLLREQFGSVVLGVVMGGVAASWATRFLTSYLYETDPMDSMAWVAASAAILTVACVGVLLPACRATRVDLVRVLRVE